MLQTRWRMSVVISLLAAASLGLNGCASPNFTVIQTLAGGIGPGPLGTQSIGGGRVLIRNGKVYLNDGAYNIVRSFDLQTGTQTVVAGIGQGLSGHGPMPSNDGGPATAAAITPQDIAFDANGNLLIADSLNNKIRKVDASGVISTVAGNGTPGFGGDGGPATSAMLSYPSSLEVDPSGNVYVTDASNHRIRKIDSTGTITTFAGNGTDVFSGDGGPAVDAGIAPGQLVWRNGCLIFVDSVSRLRSIDADGIVTTIAGNGIEGYSGDGGPAVNASFKGLVGVTLASDASLVVSDQNNFRLRRIDGAGVITTFAGTGTAGDTGDGGPASAATLSGPGGLSHDAAGNVYVYEFEAGRVRRVDPAGIITTAFGNGNVTFSGDGGPPTNAQFWGTFAVATDSSGNVYVADTTNQRIRKIGTNGTITTFAGSGPTGLYGPGGNPVNIGTYAGDGGPATAARFDVPIGVATDGTGNVYIHDSRNYRIRRVDSNGIITTFAGNGTRGTAGDGGPAVDAQIDGSWVSTDPSGNVYVISTGTIRRIDAGGIIATIAGGGGDPSDGQPALGAAVSPQGPLAFDRAGNLYFPAAGARIRKIDTNGVLHTIAGNGTTGFSGDGGPATAAQLNRPMGMAIDGAGNLYFADSYNHRVRRIDPAGTITTIVGSGPPGFPSSGGGFGGDGGPPGAALLDSPNGVALTPTGDLVVLDTWNLRVRIVYHA